MKRVLIVFGTRPEAIKMCPLVNVLKERGDQFELVVCVTGQHRSMLDSVLHTFDVVPDYDLKVMRENQSLFDITVDVMSGVRAIIERERPSLVLVHGDTTTSFAAALASFYCRVPVGHVEAGLRTYNKLSPYPEEFNRQAVDAISDLFFAPTERALKNLLAESKEASRIHVTGNTGIDALRTTIRPEYTDEVIQWADGCRLVLMTAHRRENVGKPMEEMFSAIRRVVNEHEDIKVLYPVHLNPQIRELVSKHLTGEPRVRTIAPLDVVTFHNYLARCHLVLTDSGGIQEEAPSLGKPVLVMRDTTERPEGVEAGTLRLTGTSEESIYEAFSQLLDDEETYQAMSQASNPYGDGHASERIADILTSF